MPKKKRARNGNGKIFFRVFGIIGIILLLGIFFYSSNQTKTVIAGDAVCGLKFVSEPRMNIQEITYEIEKRNPELKTIAPYIYNKGVSYGIDPAIAAAFFAHESNFAKDANGVTRRTKNLGNIRPPSSCSFDKPSCTINGRCPVTGCSCDFIDCNSNTGCFCGLNSWEQGIDMWYKLIEGQSYIGAGLDTVETVIPKYAPSSENNVDAYIDYIRTFIKKYSEIPPKCFAGTSISRNAFRVYGGYTLKPSFKIKAELDKSIYTNQEAVTKELISRCSQEQDINACVNAFIAEQNTKDPSTEWEFGCSDSTEAVFSEFVEGYRDCQDSISDQCICSFDLNIGSGNAVTGEYKIELYVNELQKYSILSLLSPETDGKMVETVYNSVFGIVNPPYNVEGELQTSALNDSIITLNYNSGSISSGAEGIKLEAEDRITNLNELGNHKIYLYKSAENLSIIDDDAISNPENMFKDMLACKQNKRNYKFCVSTKKQVTAFDKETKKVDEKDIVIKFALFIKDLVPPPKVIELSAIDAKNAEGAILVEWKDVLSEDITDYSIYYRIESDFTDLDSEGVKSSTFSILKITRKDTFYSIDTSDFRIEEGKIKYKVTDATGVATYTQIEPNKVYYIESQKKYLLLLNNLEDKTIYFAVIAKDNYGNFLEDFTTKQTQSIDDLAPGKVNLMLNGNALIEPYDCATVPTDNPATPQNEAVISLSWINPEMNSDLVTPYVDHSKYYIYAADSVDASELPECIPANGCFEETSTETTFSQGSILNGEVISAGDNICFAVVAVDDDRNYMKKLD